MRPKIKIRKDRGTQYWMIYRESKIYTLTFATFEECIEYLKGIL